MSGLSPRDALARLLQSRAFQDLETELARVSAFHILGIERRELSHAALLGWLLDPRGHHGLGTAPLRSFMLLACALKEGQPAGPDAVDVDGFELHSARVELELGVRIPGSGRQRRLDIVVSLPTNARPRRVLVIEYKVDASESDEQTADYAAWAQAQTLEQAWPTEPLLVFLCPGHLQPASERFVQLDYDAYLPWLQALLQDRPSPVARMLIEELRACLGRRSDVQDAKQEALIEALQEQEAPALALLRTLTMPPPELLSTLQSHRPALNALGLVVSRQSKGYSAFVSAFREVLQARLDPAVWRVGGGEGSLVAIYLPGVQLLHQITGQERGPSSALRVHLFMERPRKERARAVLEVIGNHPELDAVESKRLRMALSAELRAGFAERFDQATKGQIVGSFVLDAPGVFAPKDDTERRSEPLRESFEGTAASIADLGQALGGWLPSLEVALRRVQR